jgi:hypothetical protein
MSGFFQSLSQGISSGISAVCGGVSGSRVVVAETPPTSASGSDDEGGDSDDSGEQQAASLSSVRKIQFKNEGGMLKTLRGIDSAEQYLEAVMNWRSTPFAGREPFDKKRHISETNSSKVLQHVVIGEFTVAEVSQLIQDAADAAGFCIYEHKGHNEWKGKYNNRCTLKFACECGRKRYGQEKERHAKEFVVELDDVVATNCRKRRSTRKNYGYMPAFTNHRRLKNNDCPFQFSLIAYQKSAKFDEKVKALWQLSSHSRARHCFEHRGHTMRTMGRTKLTAAAKQYIVDNCEEVSIPQLVDEIQRMFTVDTDRDAVRWVVRANKKTAAQGRAPDRGRAGGAIDSIRDLMKNGSSKVILLLRQCTSGAWFTCIPLYLDGDVHFLQLTPYDDPALTPVRNPDPDRVIDIRGEQFFIHTQAWNYESQTKLFRAYPHVLQMDCQANVNKSTDGFNCVSVDGNYHNIISLRAFVGSQKAEMFRWILRVAIPALLPNYKKIRLFLCDGCDALLGELRACCVPGGVFPIAKILLCIFHLLIKNYDDTFGYALRRTQSPEWFQFFKNALMRLRNCDSIGELTECKNFVLRVAAGWSNDDFPKNDMLKFLMARIKKSDEWVLCYHVSTFTRGCSATPRCEGEHGHSRNAGVNARCSWPVTVKKYEKTLNRRRRKLLKWADKQISRTLGRSVTNANESTLTDAILTHLDSLVLPWMVDTIEVQMLLGRKESLRCIYTSDTVNASTFAVFFEDEELEDDLGAGPEVANPQGLPEIPRSPLDTSSDEREQSDDADDSSKRQSLDSTIVIDDDDEEEWTEQMQQEMEYILANPLQPNTTFLYRKVRTLTLQRDPQNGNYLLIICDCGYAPRIGCACRHVWCFLFTILKAIPRSLDAAGAAIQLCECLNHPNACEDCKAAENYKAFQWEDFPLFQFQHMINMDVASKVKYHALLRPELDANSLFEEVHSAAFHPRISAHLFQQFTRFHRPEGFANVPKAGIPENGDVSGDEDDADGGSNENPNPEVAPRRSSRNVLPTLPMISNVVQSTWDRIHRLKDSKIKAEAKSLLWTNLQDTLEQINALEPVRQPRSLTRYYSERDRVLGLANHMEGT